MLDGGVGGDVDLHAGVEVLQLREGGLGAGGLADVLAAAVEVAAHVLHGDGVGVEDGDLLGPGQDEVLGDLDS